MAEAEGEKRKAKQKPTAEQQANFFVFRPRTRWQRRENESKQMLHKSLTKSD